MLVASAANTPEIVHFLQAFAVTDGRELWTASLDGGSAQLFAAADGGVWAASLPSGCVPRCLPTLLAATTCASVAVRPWKLLCASVRHPLHQPLLWVACLLQGLPAGPGLPQRRWPGLPAAQPGGRWRPADRRSAGGWRGGSGGPVGRWEQPVRRCAVCSCLPGPGRAGAGWRQRGGRSAGAWQLQRARRAAGGGRGGSAGAGRQQRRFHGQVCARRHRLWVLPGPGR